ncbi:MAG: hypothetical protein M1825_001233 [Sarcosagium campestre]|nr:MAG: hypothetical protein M1825_001233 [Sarcosagium campestre]
MVSTRNHPTDLPPPSSPSPSKAVVTPSPKPTNTRKGVTASSGSSTNESSSTAWSHTPSNLTLAWLAVSLPLVTMDTLYVALRPYSMPGNSLHWPLFTPWAIYGAVDHSYGVRGWVEQDGFTAAQATMNAVETALYLFYLIGALRIGGATTAAKPIKGRGASKAAAAAAAGKDKGLVSWLTRARVVKGDEGAAQLVLVGFTAAIMTLAKTALYFLNEYFSGFSNISHNHFTSLLFFYIIPNGFWVILPTYMTYVFGQEILEGLKVGGSRRAGAIKDE